MLTRRVACCALAFLFMASPVQAEDYGSYFDSSWRAVTASRLGRETLLSDPNYPCHVKAYGWKLMGTERRRSKDAPWYSLGDVYQKWGYKVVVQPNPTDSNVKVDSLELRLKSDDGFLLDATVYSTAFRPEAVIRAGKTNVLQGTSSFNLSSRSGEGSPSDIDLSVSCKRIIPGK